MKRMKQSMNNNVKEKSCVCVYYNKEEEDIDI